MGKKEKVDAHPILSIHKKRCNCIRAELSKGTITRQFATAAKEIADELKTLAIHGDGYTAEQFKRDIIMSRDAQAGYMDETEIKTTVLKSNEILSSFKPQ